MSVVFEEMDNCVIRCSVDDELVGYVVNDQGIYGYTACDSSVILCPYELIQIANKVEELNQD
jgi:hypothetical protein